MPKQNRIIKILFLLSLSFLIFSCSGKPARIYLKDKLLYCETSSQTTLYQMEEHKDFIKLTKTTADNLSNALQNDENYIWIKATFTIDRELKGRDLALYIDYLRSADKVYFNGNMIGSNGGFPPKEFSAGFKAHYYPIQRELINSNGENTILIKVWPGPLGGISDDIYITEQDDAYVKAEFKTFIKSRIDLVFSGAMILVFVLYFIMHIGLSKFFENLEFIVFSLLNLFTLSFLFPFYSSELPWVNMLGVSYLTILKLTVCSGAFITIYFANSFIIAFLQYQQTRHTMQIRTMLLAIPVCITLFIPSYRALVKFVPFGFTFALVQFCFSIPLLLKAFKMPEKRSIAIQLLGGFAPVIICIFVDLIIRFLFDIKTMPYFTLYGWQITIVVFLCYLINRFNSTYSKNALLKNKLEEFNTNLEEIVSMRTKELSDANFVLSRGLEAVANVQKNFLPPAEITFPGWDVTAQYTPFKDNVSGDLYDYYIKDSKFKGLGIFDVSGHGIPAGLMTILAKGIINRHFMNSLENNDSLSTVMNKINDTYIAEKVNVENYITGLLMSCSDVTKKNTCTVQIVNAGHPHPLYYDAAANDVSEVIYKNPDEQFGMIGIEGLNVSFPATTIKSAENDVFVFYTDGLLESMDSTKEQYGIARIAKILKENCKKSSKEILESINKDFEEFLDGESVHDDITIIVAKRKKTSDFIEEL